MESGRAKWPKLKRDAGFAGDHHARKDVWRMHGMRRGGGHGHTQQDGAHALWPAMHVRTRG